MYYPFVRKALFQLDPERAHEFTFQQLRRITERRLKHWCGRKCLRNLLTAWA